MQPDWQRYKMRNLYLLAIAVIAAIVVIAFERRKIEIDQEAIQGAIRRFIQNKLESQELYFIKEVKTKFERIHEGIREKNGSFVSCVDFKYGDEVFDIDCYVKIVKGKYEVIKEVLHKKNDKAVDEVLWQQEH